MKMKVSLPLFAIFLIVLAVVTVVRASPDAEELETGGVSVYDVGTEGSSGGAQFYSKPGEGGKGQQKKNGTMTGKDGKGQQPKTGAGGKGTNPKDKKN